MRLGINLGYWGAGMDGDNLAVAQEADRLGYDVCWAAEAYGSDAPTVLSWVAARTESIDVGTAIMQIPARRAMSRERLSYEGEHWTLPLPDGPGKPIKLTVHPQREHIPLYIAAIGPRNLEQTGEIADGALLIFPSAEHLEDTALRYLRAGREKAGLTLEGFDVCPTVPLALGDDVRALADQFRPYTALYVGGMGSRRQNFYNRLAGRMGYEREAAEIQDKYLAGDKKGAAAAVPHELIDSTTLLGPVERIAERMQAYAAVGVTTLTLSPSGLTLDERLAALRAGTEALDRAGLAE
jgi:alkanesulfonate monooxygenase SsuD/methylene tetrahydromethanopterin reductase-like flavin-dependent oxidoreductase (luciferase family)